MHGHVGAHLDRQHADESNTLLLLVGFNASCLFK